MSKIHKVASTVIAVDAPGTTPLLTLPAGASGVYVVQASGLDPLGLTVDAIVLPDLTGVDPGAGALASGLLVVLNMNGLFPVDISAAISGTSGSVQVQVDVYRLD